MDHNAYPRMTALDQVICDDSLQAMKAVIPYTPFREQKMLSVFIKFMEFKKTIQLFWQPKQEMKMASAEPSAVTPPQMLQDIRQYTGGAIGETIDSLLQAFSAIEFFQMYQEMEETTSHESELDQQSQSGIHRHRETADAAVPGQPGRRERQSGTDALPDDGHETDQTEGHVLYS